LGGRIVSLIFIPVEIGSIAYLLLLVLWAMFGTDVPGAVTGWRTSHSSKGGTHYHLEYRYELGDQIRSGSDDVGYSFYTHYRSSNERNQPVTVRYYSVGSLTYDGLPAGGHLWTHVGFIAFWVAFCTFATGMFIYQSWITPRRRRLLYQEGEATAGTIVRKRARRSKSTTYYVTSRFDDPYSGKPIETEMLVWKADDWELAKEGESVTVLYSKDNPRRNVVYEYGGYCVDGSGV
jgi:hypothetical protein